MLNGYPPEYAGGGSNSENREWEVGKKGDCDNIDNAYTIKR